MKTTPHIRRIGFLADTHSRLADGSDLPQQALDAFLVELLGRMPYVTHRWAGIFGLTQDLLPLVGAVPGHPGTWVAAGYSGHGNVLGFMCGELIAAAVLGAQDPLLELFSPARLLVSG